MTVDEFELIVRTRMAEICPHDVNPRNFLFNTMYNRKESLARRMEAADIIAHVYGPDTHRNDPLVGTQTIFIESIVEGHA
jgi:hypothetical protein